MNLDPMRPINAARAIPAELHDHARDATSAARTAIHATDTSAKLDAAVRAVDDLDHLVSDTRRVPFAKGVFAKEYGAYTLAKAGLTAFVASGVVAGARERVGAADLEAAQDHLHSALALITAPGARGVDAAHASDWMGHAVGDAEDALLQLREPGVAIPLLTGLTQAREAISHGAAPTADQLTRLDALFTRASAGFADQLARIAAAAPAPVSGTTAAAAALDAALGAAAALDPAAAAAADLAPVPTG